MLVRYATTNDLSTWQNMINKLTDDQQDSNAEIMLPYMTHKIENGEALVSYDMVINTCMGFLAFSKKENRISWLGIYPNFRKLGVATALVEKALSLLDPTEVITVRLYLHSLEMCHAIEALFRKYHFVTLSKGDNSEANFYELLMTLKPIEITNGPVLSEIRSSDFGLPCIAEESDREILHAIRAIIRNSADEIALLYIKKDHYYKLPGIPYDTNIQAIESSLYQQFHFRTLLQRVVGNIMEYRDALDEVQMTCGIEFKLVESESTEASDMYDVLWVPVESAIMLIDSNSSDKYMAKYVSKRDDIFLRSLL